MHDIIWFIIAIACLAFALGVHIFLHGRCYFKCDKCGQSFKPGFLPFLFTFNSGEYKKVKCSVCGHKDYMKMLFTHKERNSAKDGDNE